MAWVPACGPQLRWLAPLGAARRLVPRRGGHPPTRPARLAAPGNRWPVRRRPGQTYPAAVAHRRLATRLPSVSCPPRPPRLVGDARRCGLWWSGSPMRAPGLPVSAAGSLARTAPIALSPPPDQPTGQKAADSRLSVARAFPLPLRTSPGRCVTRHDGTRGCAADQCSARQPSGGRRNSPASPRGPRLRLRYCTPRWNGPTPGLIRRVVWR